METPSSTRRMTTRSLAYAAAEKSRQQEDSALKARNERPALLDITNDSPIVGVAAGAEKTPSSTTLSRRRAMPKRTPGSGEALLRGQVETLLQKVEQNCGAAAAIAHPAAPRLPPFASLLGVVRSPVQLLAPTPVNTPQLPDVSVSGVETLPPVVAEDLAMTKEKDLLGDCVLNRALLFDDSPDKSSMSAESSSVTLSSTDKSQEDDSSSAWSLYANRGSLDGLVTSTEEAEEEVEEEEDEAGSEQFEFLCDGMRKMCVSDGALLLPEFKGKHTRFVYDEVTGEMIRKEEDEAALSPSVTVLRGMPAPEGKHLRFHD